jgi:hypothetical protein
MCNVTLRRARESLVPWKSNTYYIFVCVCACAHVHVALLMQHATLMHNIVTSFVTPRSLPHFSTLSHKRCDYRTKVTEDKMCAFIYFCPEHTSF